MIDAHMVAMVKRYLAASAERSEAVDIASILWTIDAKEKAVPSREEINAALSEVPGLRVSCNGGKSSLFGGTEFTVRTLRFVWHLTSIAWWGAAALLFLMAQRPLSSAAASGVLAGVFLVSAVITLVASRGRHLAWPVFLAIGIIALYGAQA